jgi:hypothetical protein
MIEQLVARVFHARNVSHWSHWRTKSYAEHQALGAFYDEVIEALDSIVEAHQGANDLIGNIPAPDSSGASILALLQDDAAWIEEHHEEICGGNRAIANLIDSLTDKYLSTIYKLRFLK